MTKKSRKPEVPSRSRLKKDPGIPRLPDIKPRVKAHNKRNASVPIPPRVDPDSHMASEPTITTLARLAADSSLQSNFTTDGDDLISNDSIKTKEQIRRHHVRTLHKVIEQSDIIVLVLDARDPEGCRSRLVEEEVLRRESEGKRLIFVLNKIDLVPRENAQAWLRYLRHTTPTLPFRSASNNQRTHLSSRMAPALLHLLKAHKPTLHSITVGVVGYPNVGKSSLINSLKRTKVCAVAAQPGHTKDLQSVQLERGIRVLDSPGVVFDEDTDPESSGKTRQKGNILLRNVVRVEDIEDPIAVVEEIIARTDHNTLEKIYNLPPFASTLEFLTTLALTTGRLLKGGTPDILASARQVLADWNRQKIPYFSVPPNMHPSSVPSTIASSMIAPGAENVGQAKILDAFSKPFELAGLFDAADAGAFGSALENNDGGDELMVDGETYWDAQEDITPGGGADGVRMNEDVDISTHALPRKRPLSPSVPSVGYTGIFVDRQPKRQRRMKAQDPILEETVTQTGSRNRRAQKRAAKRIRRVAGRAARALSRDLGKEEDADMEDREGINMQGNKFISIRSGESTMTSK